MRGSCHSLKFQMNNLTDNDQWVLSTKIAETVVTNIRDILSPSYSFFVNRCHPTCALAATLLIGKRGLVEFARMEELKQKFQFWHERRTNCSLLTGVEFFRASNAASQWLIQDNSTTSESDRNQDFMTHIDGASPACSREICLAGSLLSQYQDTFFYERLYSILQLQEMKFACTWNLYSFLRRPEGARWKGAATPISSPRKRDLPILKKIKSACFNRSFSLSRNKKVN